MTFLRSLFATRTVLFIGVSFTDAHLNELRTEMLAMFDHDGDDEPVAYATLSDVQPHQVRYLRSHEGLGAITFDTAEVTDWSGFGAILRSIHDATNPRAQLGQAIADRTILWVDPESDDTVDGASMAPTWSCSTGRWARQCSRQCEPRTSHRVRPLARAEGVRRAALAPGATETIADWPDLFREIERVLGPS